MSASNSLAQTPPMGFRTWNEFGLNVNQTMMEAAFRALASTAISTAAVRTLALPSRSPLNEGQHELARRETCASIWWIVIVVGAAGAAAEAAMATRMHVYAPRGDDRSHSAGVVIELSEHAAGERAATPKKDVVSERKG